jgi:titin
LENVVALPGVSANAGTSSGSAADSQVAPLHDANVIQGNLIGLDVTGSLALPNGANGVDVVPGGLGATNDDCTIGGTGPGAGNVISGNMAYGILLSDTSGNVAIEGNKIGTDKIGTVAVPNHLDGIYVSDSSNNTITGNLISGNGRFGIFLLGQPSSGAMVSSSSNVVQNNIIGLGQGAGGLGNADDGVVLFAGATNNTIGGSTPGTGNLISGNDRFGVYLNGSGTTGNLIQGNRIGTSVDATFNQGNILDGIAVFVGPSDNTIGGTASGAGNVISGNGRDGVYLGNAGSGNVLQGNFIGTSGDGSSVLPNGGTGVALQAVSATILGGTAGGAGNLIAGNLEGVVLIGAGTKGNLLQGNTIGSRPSVFNTFGVDIQGGASNNTVGGTTSGAGNTIAFDINGGVVIGNSPADATTVGNAILGNAIYSTQMGLGIDLGKDGLTLNGPGGAARSGPNDLQNYPVLNSATVRGTGAGNAVVIAFSFTSVASASFRLEFFLNNSSEPPQGHTFLGTFDVTTDASGNITSVTGGSVTGGVATITLTPPAGVNPSPGQLLTATATLTNNNGKPGSGTVGDTSEFSRPVTVVLSAT